MDVGYILQTHSHPRTRFMWHFYWEFCPTLSNTLDNTLQNLIIVDSKTTVNSSSNTGYSCNLLINYFPQLNHSHALGSF